MQQAAILEAFADLPDRRRGAGQRHSLCALPYSCQRLPPVTKALSRFGLGPIKAS